MDKHSKGLRLGRKACAMNANTPKARRIVRRMLRTLAAHWEGCGEVAHARALRHDAKNLR
jgi:hypothetical protein